MKKKKFDLEKIRETLKGLTGPKFWRSLDQIAETDDFKAYLREEYPHGAQLIDSPVSRRNFLKLMGASLLLSSFPGCSKQPLEKIVANVKAREYIVPGKPLFFATAMPFNGAATGLLVESHMGRPTKVEGSERHPDSLGATNVFHQAAILGLYDPERSKVITHQGAISTWASFTQAIKKELKALEVKEGEGFRLLTETVISPTLKNQIDSILEKYPKAKWHQYEPVNRDNARKAQILAFGKHVDPLYDFQNSDTIISLGSDFLVSNPGSLRYAKRFSEKRKVSESKKDMNRLYAIEATPTLTGASADHLLSVPTSHLISLTRALAAKIGVKTNKPDTHLTEDEKHWVEVAAKDILSQKGKSLVIAGESEPVEVQVLTHAMNQVLENIGTTVKYVEPIVANPEDQLASLKELEEDLDSGKVELLVVLEGNPVFNTPRNLRFGIKYRKAKTRVHFGLYENETAVKSNWHIPAAHFLETFSDARATFGIISTIQPLIEPLYGGKSVHSFMAAFLGDFNASDYEIVRENWRRQYSGGSFEKDWRKSLHDGGYRRSRFNNVSVKTKTDWNNSEVSSFDLKHKQPGSDEIELVFRPDPTIWDGRFNNNGWLQELPKPFTKLTWDNALLLAPKTAEKLGVSNEDVVALSYGRQLLEIPVWILPGHAVGSGTIHLGYGRKHTGQVGKKTGFDAYKLQSSVSPNYLYGVKIQKTGKTYALATTQMHQNMEGRDLVRQGTLKDFKEHPDFAQHHVHGDPKFLNFYPPHEYEGYAWGMTVDLGSCTGCNACTIACQSENNIPIVGKEEVLRGREMHWIRVDGYFEGELDHPDILHQPVMCMHCENAPCEPVCPVGATVHSDEGLNEMVYNRCVGTRYCSNNCPYKVRRFNFFEYAKQEENFDVFELLRNPDVTVRNRGVMEKCTFCVQRINHARIDSKKENRKIRDGEIKTACQQVCPTQAITFGDINDPNSEVSKLKQSPLNYGILTELNTQPRVTYLAKVKNPHPELMKHVGLHAGAHH